VVATGVVVATFVGYWFSKRNGSASTADRVVGGSRRPLSPGDAAREREQRDLAKIRSREQQLREQQQLREDARLRRDQGILHSDQQWTGEDEDEDLRKALENSLQDEGLGPIDYRLEESRSIRKQQDREFQESLKQDRLKEEKLEKEKQEKERLIKEQQDKERKLKESRQRKKENLPAEPEQTENVTTIAIKLPNGTRYSRKFLLDDKLSVLLDYIESLGLEVELPTEYEVAGNGIPKKTFHNIPHPTETTLRDQGLSSRELLSIIPL